MKVVVAPDSFKGSISAREVCNSISKGIYRVFPNAEVHKVPLADGGEGTMENMVYSSSGDFKVVNVKDPLGRDIEGSYGVIDDQKVIIEMAQASGLPLISEEERNPLRASSYGTGQLISHALDHGYRQFIIGLGGSATNDAGTGMLRALGVKFYGEKGVSLPEGGEALQDLQYIDETELDPRIREASFTIASDVTNKLCGPKGASAIFGPQKGASSLMVEKLDQSLNHFAKIVSEKKGIDMLDLEGGGAAGGMGASLITFLGAKLKNGIDVVMEGIGFSEIIRGADLIISGEGKLDQQTLGGKVIHGVTRASQKDQIPVLALCGSLQVDGHQMNQLGIVSAYSIIPRPCSLEEAIHHTPEWISDKTENIMRTLRCKTFLNFS